MSGTIVSLFNNSHFSSITSVKAMSKRTQEDAGEQRVTAKCNPMTSLVSRCRVRDPTVLASTASENPVNTKSEGQNVHLSPLKVQQTGTERLPSNKLVIGIDKDSDTATESDFSLKSRSFLNRVNDRLRKMLNRSSESMQDMENVFLIWRMFMSSTVEASVFMRISQTITFHQKYRVKYHFKADVRDI